MRKDSSHKHKCDRCGAAFASNDRFLPERLHFDGALTACPTCIEAERVEQVVCPASQADLARRRYEVLCPAKIREDPTDWARLPDQVAANKVVGWKYGARGLLSHGVTGLGKTRAMWALIRRLVEAGRDVHAYDGERMGLDISARSSGDADEFKRWVQLVTRHEVLFIDDFGKGNITPVRAETFFGFIKQRDDADRPTLLTTNTLGDTLEAMFGQDVGPPLTRRLTEDFDEVVFSKAKENS